MRKKTITYNPKHYSKQGVIAGVIYGKGDKKIREQKVVKTRRKLKTVNYSQVDYYGKQKKTRSKVNK